MNIVFDHATTDQISNPIKKEKGRLFVQIAGVLDGADVITSVMGDFGEKMIIATCSWRTSAQETIPSELGYKADYGYDDYVNGDVFAEIQNAGASTDISLSVYVLGGE